MDPIIPIFYIFPLYIKNMGTLDSIGVYELRL